MRLLLSLTICLGTINFIHSDLLFDFQDPLRGFFKLFPPTAVTNIHQTINSQKPDENTIIRNILSNTHKEIHELSSAYYSFYKIDLIQSLRNILTGELEDAVVSWMRPRNHYYAREIYGAINGIDADERAIIDILCVFNNTAIRNIENAYFKLYSRSMTDDLMNVLPQSFKKLLHLSREHRQHFKFNANDVMNIIQSESSFVDFLANHPSSDIHEFAMKYYKQSGTYLEKTVTEKYSGDLQRAILSILYHTKSMTNFFSRRLHESLEGDIVDYHSLIRLAIMDKKVTYNEISDLYKQQYRKNLDAVMSQKLGSGNFRKFIQGLFERKVEIPYIDESVLVW